MLSVGRLLFGLLRWAFFRSQTDAFNFHARQFASMANCAVITFASLVLERDHFLVFALFQNFSRHLCSRNERFTVRHIVSVGKHQYVTKGRGLSGIDLENIDVDRVAFRDAELSATSLDDCVSHSVRGEKPPKIPQLDSIGNRKGLIGAAADLIVIERMRCIAARCWLQPMLIQVRPPAFFTEIR